MSEEEEEEEELLVSGTRFDVVRLALPRRDGGVERREFVRHPGSVVVLPLVEPDQVVLIRNRRAIVGDTLWELCAGTRAPQEAPLECAHRELAEETGYRAGRMEPAFDFFPAPGISDERMWVFVASDLTLGPVRLDPTENIETHLRTREACRGMMTAGEVRDGKTLLVLRWWLDQP